MMDIYFDLEESILEEEKIEPKPELEPKIRIKLVDYSDNEDDEDEWFD